MGSTRTVGLTYTQNHLRQRVQLRGQTLTPSGARNAGLVWVRSRHPTGFPLLRKEHRCSRTCTTRQKPRVPVRAAVNPAGGRRLRGARCSMREARAAVIAVTVKEGQQSSATVVATHASSPAPVWGKSVGGPSTSGATTKTATDDDVSVRGC